MENLDNLNITVCKNIKTYRLEKGLSIKELSEKSGVSEKYLLKIENLVAKRLVLLKVVAIADAMEMNVYKLFEK